VLAELYDAGIVLTVFVHMSLSLSVYLSVCVRTEKLLIRP